MADPPVRVLVIDDDQSVRDSLVNFLDDLGFEASSAHSAEDALGVLERGPQDVAIVDIRLPGASGDAVILQAHEACSGLRFLIYTGSVGYTLPQALEEVGMRPEHVFHKPLADLTELVEAVRDVVQEQQA